MAKRATVVRVDLEERESSENLIRRFIRVCKKEGIVESCKLRMEHKTKSQRKRLKRERSYARKKAEERKKEKREMREKKLENKIL